MRVYKTGDINKPTPHSGYRGRVLMANAVLLSIFIFSTMNAGFALFGQSFYSPMASFMPYAAIDMGMLYCGQYPDSFYTGDWEGYNCIPGEYFSIFVIFAFIWAFLFLVAFLISLKKKTGGYILALILLSLDFIVIFKFYIVDFLTVVELLFHVLFMANIASGIWAIYRLKELPSEEEYIKEYAPKLPNEPSEELSDSMPIRAADLTQKSRTLLELNANNHNILYRRVKKTNELVIDGQVYAEYVASIEYAHELCAVIDGITYSVGYDPTFSKSYAKINYKTVSEKMRWM